VERSRQKKERVEEKKRAKEEAKRDRLKTKEVKEMVELILDSSLPVPAESLYATIPRAKFAARKVWVTMAQFGN
jgi:hypothetical protein